MAICPKSGAQTILNRICGMMSAVTVWLVGLLLGFVGSVSTRMRRDMQSRYQSYSCIIWPVKTTTLSAIVAEATERTAVSHPAIA